MKYKVLIIEPSELIVEGLMRVLGGNVKLRLLAPMRDMTDWESRLAMLQPDVLIVNPTLCDNVQMLRGSSSLQVLALVYQYVRLSRLRSFDGVVDVRDNLSTIVQTVADAADNSNIDPLLKASRANNYDLTKRETAVLIEVARGLTNKEIAERLNVSVFTVTTHRKNIVRKTGIKSVAGLTVYALLNNLIDEEDVN